MDSATATQIIELICQKLGIAFDYTTENVLPYLQSLMQELANCKFYTHLMFSIIFGIFLIVGIIFTIIGMYKKDIDIAGWGLAFDATGLIGTIIAIYYTISWKVMPTIMAYKWIINTLNN